MYHIKQVKGWLEDQKVIEKDVSSHELEDLGFFPLDPYEQRVFREKGIITICGDLKYTTITEKGE